MELKQLGNKVEMPANPNEAVLERIQVKDPNLCNSVVRFSCPEFTSLCPVTGQPDFARFYIDFVPKSFLVESKSVKLFMCSFRNHGAFHEEVTCYIARRIEEAIAPIWLRVTGIWYPRGGIPLDITWQTSDPPKGVYILPIDYKTFDGR